MAAFDTTRTFAPEGNAFTRTYTHLVGLISAWNDARVTKAALSKLSDAELNDIGLTRGDIDALVSELAALTVAETAEIPSLEPRRAPVILAGTVVAQRVMDALGAERVLVSEYDLLDGLAARVAALGQG